MEFKLPEMGEGVVEGELVSWLVKPGDQVTTDQPICEVMTDKATIEVPSPVDGTIAELLAKEGDTVEVDQVMMTYKGGTSASKAPAAKKEAEKASAPAPAAAAPQAKAPQPAAVAASAPVTVAGTSPDSRPLAAPATRKYASELGVDIGQVSGSGPSGRILKGDVEQFLSRSQFMPGTAARTSFPAGGEKRVPFKGLRKKIAEKMRLSVDKAAHFTYVEEADASQLVSLRKKAKIIGAQQGVKVTFLPFIMKAMVSALKQYPVLNSTLDEETNELVYKHYYNISLSIQTDDGLTAPVVKNVEHKSIMEIARDIQTLVDKARTKKLTMDDFQGGTITLTNAGSIGGLFATPVINFPEVAILGFNKIFKKPVVKEINGRDRVVIRDWTYFSISLDHRIVDGAVGAEFMNTFIQYVENPSLMLLESF